MQVMRLVPEVLIVYRPSFVPRFMFTEGGSLVERSPGKSLIAPFTSSDKVARGLSNWWCSQSTDITHVHLSTLFCETLVTARSLQHQFPHNGLAWGHTWNHLDLLTRQFHLKTIKSITFNKAYHQQRNIVFKHAPHVSMWRHAFHKQKKRWRNSLSTMGFGKQLITR